MAILYSASINSKMYMSADKAEFDKRLALAKQRKEDVEDKNKESLDEMDLERLRTLENLTGARDTEPTPSAVRAIKEAIKEAEEDF